jgi:hypothetical protein
MRLDSFCSPYQEVQRDWFYSPICSPTTLNQFQAFSFIPSQLRGLSSVVALMTIPNLTISGTLTIQI